MCSKVHTDRTVIHRIYEMSAKGAVWSNAAWEMCVCVCMCAVMVLGHGWRLFLCLTISSWVSSLKEKTLVKSCRSLVPNSLWMPCPLMEASSHGKGGNQINCMSVNRITSSLTCSESKLKLVTNACRSEGMGEARREGRRERQSQGFPSQWGLPPPHCLLL